MFRARARVWLRAGICYWRTSVQTFRWRVFARPLHSTVKSTCTATQPTATSHTPSPDPRNILSSITELSSKEVDLSHVELLHQLTSLLLSSPEASHQAWELMGVVSKLVKLQECGLEEVEQQARLSLSLLGYVPTYSGRGLRILSIDGGGTRYSFSLPPSLVQ